jgi:hypothetical protein
MARVGFYVTVGQSLGDGHYSLSTRQGGADIEATVATLVADAGAPTQAHVTSLSTALTARGDVHLSYDTTKVTTLNQLKRAVAAILHNAQGAGLT